MAQSALHSRYIPTDYYRHSREQRQNIGYKLCFADSKEQQHENPPNVEEQQLTHIIYTAFADGCFSSLPQHTGPGEQT